MRTIVAAILLSSIASAVYATSQAPEVLVYDGTDNDLYSTPLESFFSPENPKPRLFFERPVSTACRRGYVGTWRIENDELYLVALQDGYPATGIIPLDRVNPQWKSPVKATWFTGTIRIGRGGWVRGRFWRSDDLNPLREIDIFFEIKDGVVVSIRQVDNTEERGIAEPEIGPVRR